MFSLGMYPAITKPTRISNVSATLIDNIFTNYINRDITSGLLITEISDHLSVFAVCKNDGNLYNRSDPARYIRETSVENISALKAAFDAHSWETVLYYTDVNEA